MAKKQKSMVSETQSIADDAGIMMVWMFVLIKVVTALVLFVANLWMPMNVVLGNQSLTPLWAIILSSGAIALITTFVFPFIQKYTIQFYHMLKPMEWMAAYFVIDFVVLWWITRYSEVFGLGVTSWMVVLVLAAVMDLLQGFAIMFATPKPKK